MIKPVAIEKRPEQHPALNFDFLRSVGIELLQKYAGQKWTDFNLHDPGVTILEQLCFAITDLAYRTDFPINDLLADENGEIDLEHHAFFHREDVLTTNPVSINDIRKVLIDALPEVDNIWLYPVSTRSLISGLSGLYRVVVQVSPNTAARLNSDRGLAEEIKRSVRKVLVSVRNLCEDVLQDIRVLNPLMLTVEADILVKDARNPEEVLARVYQQLEKTINQPVRQFAEKELRERGYTTDMIFDGPLLTKGFIPDPELHPRRASLDPTELTKAISQVPGVLSVKRLKILNGPSGRSNKPMKLPENTFPLLDVKNSGDNIKLYIDKFELPIRKPLLRSLLQKISDADNRTYISSFYQRPHERLRGLYRDNLKYYSIQEQFPKIYGIGSEGLLKSATKLRKAQAKQLKGYLLLFEQVLANYSAQLANLKNIFSVDVEAAPANTYFHNPVYNIPDVKPLLRSFTNAFEDPDDEAWEAFMADKQNSYQQKLDSAAESDAAFSQRKNKLLDHLLARFNEFLVSHPVSSYITLYDQSSREDRLNAELRWKADIIKTLPQMGYNRVRGVDYLHGTGSDKIDFNDRMRALLYISENNGNQLLSDALDPRTVSVETVYDNPNNPYNPYADQADADEHSEDAWMGESSNILISREMMRQMHAKGLIAEADEMPQDAFLLRRQKLSVLKDALDINNYRVGPERYSAPEGAHVILYRAPGDNMWTPISRASSQNDAMLKLKGLIKYVRDINTASEGFYAVEHVLLRPDLNDRVFGFRFIARNGEQLMEHLKWMSFDEREEVITRILDLLNEDGELSPEKLVSLCKLNLQLDETEFPVPAEGDPEEGTLQNLLNYFRSLAVNREKFLSRFEMLVKMDNRTVIREDFFSLRMTVLFPAWPARFQDKNFRSAAETLFRLNSPAHLTINFAWIGIREMRRFESLYADWKQFMSGQRSDDLIEKDLRTVLIQILSALRN